MKKHEQKQIQELTLTDQKIAGLQAYLQEAIFIIESFDKNHSFLKGATDFLKSLKV